MRRRAVALVAVALTLFAGLISGWAAPAVASSDSGVPLTFDWPLDCPIEVDQHHEVAGRVFDATFEVVLTETATSGTGTSGSGRVSVDFSAATMPDSPADVEAYYSNPSLAVTEAGDAIGITGLDPWLADFRAAGVGEQSFGTDQAERELSYRVPVATWGTWVGTWADLGSVATDNVVTLDDVAYRDEFGNEHNAPLTIESLVAPDGEAVLVAERSITGDELVELWRNGYEPATSASVDPDRAAQQVRVTTMEVVTDAATLEPQSARYQVTLAPIDDPDDTEVLAAYDWEFDFSACPLAVDGPSVADLPDDPVVAPTAPSTTTSAQPSIPSWVPEWMDIVTLDELPAEALDTLDAIDNGGPFEYRQDDSVFQNREGILPDRPQGHYREYTVETPGSDDRGARRIIAGADGELFYTDDHYDSFRAIVR